MRELPAFERSKTAQGHGFVWSLANRILESLSAARKGRRLLKESLRRDAPRSRWSVPRRRGNASMGKSYHWTPHPGVRTDLVLRLRVPCGVVVAITPFNFPLNLVCHKVGPALAAGNAVIIKPPSDTPLSALKLVEILLEAGLPPLAIHCVTGGGRLIGEALCSNPRVRKISLRGAPRWKREFARSPG